MDRSDIKDEFVSGKAKYLIMFLDRYSMDYADTTNDRLGILEYLSKSDHRTLMSYLQLKHDAYVTYLSKFFSDEIDDSNWIEISRIIDMERS